jgi:hypothetical protein
MQQEREEAVPDDAIYALQDYEDRTNQLCPPWEFIYEFIYGP